MKSSSKSRPASLNSFGSSIAFAAFAFTGRLFRSAGVNRAVVGLLTVLETDAVLETGAVLLVAVPRPSVARAVTVNFAAGAARAAAEAATDAGRVTALVLATCDAAVAGRGAALGLATLEAAVAGRFLAATPVPRMVAEEAATDTGRVRDVGAFEAAPPLVGTTVCGFASRNGSSSSGSIDQKADQSDS